MPAFSILSKKDRGGSHGIEIFCFSTFTVSSWQKKQNMLTGSFQPGFRIDFDSVVQRDKELQPKRDLIRVQISPVRQFIAAKAMPFLFVDLENVAVVTPELPATDMESNERILGVLKEQEKRRTCNTKDVILEIGLH